MHVTRNKVLALLIITSIISLSKAAPESKNALQTDIDHAYNLPCGDCVAGGFNFCWKSEVPGQVLSNDEYPNKKSPETNTDEALMNSRCCKNDEDNNCNNIVRGDEAKQQKWICSYSYKSTHYGLHVCPFKRTSCGPLSYIDFYKINDDGAIHIQNLPKGEACTYQLASVCGAPSFKTKQSKDINIYFSEWQQNQIGTKTPVTKKKMSDSDTLKASPLQGMPTRDQTFISESQKNKEKGIPTFGSYKKKEWKAWGNNIQVNLDDAKLGRRYSSEDKECIKRNILITVVSTKSNAELLLELQSQSFQAVFLKRALFLVIASTLSFYL